jgi:hypothetical protein
MLSPLRNRAHRRLGEPFGKAGLTVAVIALVMALVGGAYAAGTLTSKQKKEVEKIAKKFQGTGPAGAQGPAGANGKDGSNGSNGANGEKGEKGDKGEKGANGTGATTTSFSGEKTVGSVTCKEGGVEVKSASPATAVCNGSPWSAGGTLPPGETETGFWNLDWPTASHAQVVNTSISFPIPLAAPGAVGSAFGFRASRTANHEFGSSGCTGSVAVPTAPPGKLCVYTAKEVAEVESPPGSEEEGFDWQPQSWNGGPNPVEHSYGTTGAYLAGIQIPIGLPVISWGTWAVTAPTAP